MHTLPQHRQLDIYDGDEDDDNADDQLSILHQTVIKEQLLQ